MLQEVLLVSIGVHDNLNEYQNAEHNFYYGWNFLPCLGFGVQDDANVRVVPNWEDAPHKEVACAKHVPVCIVLTSVKVGCAAHEEHCPGNTHNDADSRFMFTDIECMIVGGLNDPKVGEDVTEDQKHSPSDSAEPEDDVLWVMISSGTDPGMGEGLLVMEVLG